MKAYVTSLMSLFLLLAVAGCGKEQFGTTSQTESSKPDALKVYQQVSCTNQTILKPKVDIIYFVDNSSSTAYVPSDLKTAITNTVNSVSSSFDYRIIGTSLITMDDNDFNFMTNSSDSLPNYASKKIISSSEFNFFKSYTSDPEYGLRRINKFITTHKASGIIRPSSNLIVVVISNGRDIEVEKRINSYQTGIGFICMNGNGTDAYANESGCDSLGGSVFRNRLNTFNGLVQGFASVRFFGVTARYEGCKTNWLSSVNSYMKISTDFYDLCNGSVSSIFAGVNQTIQQIQVPHKYKLWPITSTDNPAAIDSKNIHVYKSSPTTAPVKLTSGWSYLLNSSGASKRITTSDSPAEYSTAKHFVEFNDDSIVQYPDCISVLTTNIIEIFGYVVIPKKPNTSTISLKINGKVIPESSTDGWSYIAYQERNIKVEYMGYPATPEIKKAGYMIQLNGSNNYYKSGDSVELTYKAATN